MDASLEQIYTSCQLLFLNRVVSLPLAKRHTPSIVSEIAARSEPYSWVTLLLGERGLVAACCKDIHREFEILSAAVLAFILWRLVIK